jgi:hypothetical protein
MAAKRKTIDSPSFEAGITPVGEIPSHLAMLVYGRAGTGKTAFSSTFPKPLLLLDIQEKGTETISMTKDVFVRSIEHWEELEQGYWYLKNGEQRFQSVVIDQISQLQALAMNKIKTDNSMEPTDTFSKRDWGQLSGLLQTWLMNYRNLWDRYHVCFVAHERSNVGEEEIEDQINPNIGARVMPSLQGFLNGAVSAIGNTFIRERFLDAGQGKKTRQVEYCMRLGPHAYYTTKARKPIESEIEVPDVIVNPSFEKIMAISRGEEIQRKKVKRSE